MAYAVETAHRRFDTRDFSDCRRRELPASRVALPCWRSSGCFGGGIFSPAYKGTRQFTTELSQTAEPRNEAADFPSPHAKFRTIRTLEMLLLVDSLASGTQRHSDHDDER